MSDSMQTTLHIFVLRNLGNIGPSLLLRNHFAVAEPVHKTGGSVIPYRWSLHQQRIHRVPMAPRSLSSGQTWVWPCETFRLSVRVVAAALGTVVDRDCTMIAVWGWRSATVAEPLSALTYPSPVTEAVDVSRCRAATAFSKVSPAFQPFRSAMA